MPPPHATCHLPASGSAGGWRCGLSSVASLHYLWVPPELWDRKPRRNTASKGLVWEKLQAHPRTAMPWLVNEARAGRLGLGVAECPACLAGVEEDQVLCRGQRGARYQSDGGVGGWGAI